MGRAAGDAGVRQVGAAGLEFHPFEVEPERIGRDLSKRSPGALAHVVGAGLHHAGAIAADHRARLGLEHQRRKCRGADPPTDQQAGLVAQLSWRKQPSRPAEPFGSLRVAFAQRFG